MTLATAGHSAGEVEWNRNQGVWTMVPQFYVTSDSVITHSKHGCQKSHVCMGVLSANGNLLRTGSILMSTVVKGYEYLLCLYWLSNPSLCITSFTPEGLGQHEESIMGEAAGWELRPRMCKANSRIRGGNGVGQPVGYRELQ